MSWPKIFLIAIGSGAIGSYADSTLLSIGITFIVAAIVIKE